MKIALALLFLVIFYLVMVRLTNANERGEEYNRYMCANYGYEDDCKTSLPEERRLK